MEEFIVIKTKNKGLFISDSKTPIGTNQFEITFLMGSY
jgi:hypothetical protein